MDCERTSEGVCGWCDKPLTGKRTRWCSTKCSRLFVANHRWTQAKALKKRDTAQWQCEVCGEFTANIEVNHIVPCKGQHGVWGCHHHQDNLQLVCPPCHKVITNEQRKRGWT